MKTTQELAQVILNKRNSLNPLIMPGQLVNEIGSDGLQEALRRRWLIADTDSGYLQVNNQLSIVEEIRNLAEICEACGHKTCECVARQQESDKATPSHQFVMEHAQVKPSTFICETKIEELLAPGTGHDSSAGSPTRSAPATPFKPAVPVSPTSSRQQQGAINIGDDVLVAQEGRTFQGKVGSMLNGRFVLSFGANKPPREMDYGPEQLRLVQKAAPAVHA